MSLELPPIVGRAELDLSQWSASIGAMRKDAADAGASVDRVEKGVEAVGQASREAAADLNKLDTAVKLQARASEDYAIKVDAAAGATRRHVSVITSAEVAERRATAATVGATVAKVDLAQTTQLATRGADQHSRAMIEEAGNTRAAGKAAAEAAEQKRGLNESLKQIGRTVGSQSAFGRFTQVLTGGALVGGLTLATRAAGDMGEKLADVSVRFREGEIGAGGIAYELTRSLPILGDLVRLGEGFGEVITGAASQARSVAESLARGEVIGNVLNGLQRGGGSLTDVAAATRREVDILNAPADQQASMRREDELKARIEQLTKLRDAERAKAFQESSGAVTAATAEADQAMERAAALKLERGSGPISAMRDASIAAEEEAAIDDAVRFLNLRDQLEAARNERLQEIQDTYEQTVAAERERVALQSQERSPAGSSTRRSTPTASIASGDSFLGAMINRGVGASDELQQSAKRAAGVRREQALAELRDAGQILQAELMQIDARFDELVEKATTREEKLTAEQARQSAKRIAIARDESRQRQEAERESESGSRAIAPTEADVIGAMSGRDQRLLVAGTRRDFQARRMSAAARGDRAGVESVRREQRDRLSFIRGFDDMERMPSRDAPRGIGRGAGGGGVTATIQAPTATEIASALTEQLRPMVRREIIDFQQRLQAAAAAQRVQGGL